MNKQKKEVTKVNLKDLEFIIELRKHPELYKEACKDPKEFANKIKDILKEEIEKENLKK